MKEQRAKSEEQRAKSGEGVICMVHIQDLTGFSDQYCVDCWNDSEQIRRSYPDREICYEENTVPESQFDEIERRRRMAGVYLKCRSCDKYFKVDNEDSRVLLEPELHFCDNCNEEAKLWCEEIERRIYP